VIEQTPEQNKMERLPWPLAMLSAKNGKKKGAGTVD